MLPARLRAQFGLAEGSTVIAEPRQDGILIRPADSASMERYTPERRAEFLLSNAVDAKDYAKALRQVRRMGLDPAKIVHRKPRGT